ncbi:hypothetical protein ACFX1Q_010382 [Malus domestica]
MPRFRSGCVTKPSDPNPNLHGSYDSSKLRASNSEGFIWPFSDSSMEGSSETLIAFFKCFSFVSWTGRAASTDRSSKSSSLSISAMDIST